MRSVGGEGEVRDLEAQEKDKPRGKEWSVRSTLNKFNCIANENSDTSVVSISMYVSI